MLHTSILDIYEVLFYHSMRYIGIQVHPYTMTPLKLGQMLAILGVMSSGNDAMMSWLRL